jgi:hypothetical protein
VVEREGGGQTGEIQPDEQAAEKQTAREGG